jgi:cyclophilin family peptidyl-prolyl cis-trans isomerase
MGKRSRERQLKRLAERRAEERRRRRRNRILAMVVGGIFAAAAIGVGAILLLGGGDEPRTEAAAEANPGPTGSPAAEEGGTVDQAGQVACGGEAPAAAGEKKPEYDAPPEMQLDRAVDYRAVMKTSCGTIVLDLYEDKTPITVNNFVFLARDGFYDGTVFHRVIADFMDQAGDPLGTGMGGPGYQFEDEFDKSLRFDRPGLLAMANAGPNTNGSQFFLTVAPTEWLTGKHTIFGEVSDGYEVVEAISKVPTGPQDRPLEDVVLERVEIAEG